MTDFDDRLTSSLGTDDEEFLKSLEEERGVFTQMFDTFQGPMRFWMVFVFLLSIVFFAIAVRSVFGILEAESARNTALWSAAFSFSILAVAMLKIFVWMRMNHLSILRELKKIELRITRLSYKD